MYPAFANADRWQVTSGIIIGVVLTVITAITIAEVSESYKNPSFKIYPEKINTAFMLEVGTVFGFDLVSKNLTKNRCGETSCKWSWDSYPAMRFLVRHVRVFQSSDDWEVGLLPEQYIVCSNPKELLEQFDGDRSMCRILL